jgi:hypothetical protein
MNDALRLLRKLVRFWGYDLVSSPDYVLRPIANAETLPNGPELQAVKSTLDRQAKTEAGESLDHLRVYLRTCVRADRNKTADNAIASSFEEATLICLSSLVESLNEAAGVYGSANIEVLVLDDRSTEAAREKMMPLLKDLSCAWTFRESKVTGAGGSLLEQFSDARGTGAVCYFCEDDYLHERSAVRELWDFYRMIHDVTGGHCILHPQEHELLYRAHYASYLLRGSNRHWRTMSHATHTLFTHANVVERHWNCFENTKYVGNRKKRRLGSERNTTNRLFEIMPGFCPIPAVAAHIQQENLLPPYFDWRPLWTRHREKVKGLLGPGSLSEAL